MCYEDSTVTWLRQQAGTNWQRELAKPLADNKRGGIAIGHSGSVPDLLRRWLKVIVSNHRAPRVEEHLRLVAVTRSSPLSSGAEA